MQDTILGQGDREGGRRGATAQPVQPKNQILCNRPVFRETCGCLHLLKNLQHRRFIEIGIVVDFPQVAQEYQFPDAVLYQHRIPAQQIQHFGIRTGFIHTIGQFPVRDWTAEVCEVFGKEAVEELHKVGMPIIQAVLMNITLHQSFAAVTPSQVLQLGNAVLYGCFQICIPKGKL